MAQKLGIKAGMGVAVVHGPPNVKEILGPLPDGARVSRGQPRPGVSLIVAFVTERATLVRDFAELTGVLPPNGVLWVAWPKKASKVPTDLSDNAIREVALPTGWVDTKVCAIDATWSGLKLVLRKQLRP